LDRALAVVRGTPETNDVQVEGQKIISEMSGDDGDVNRLLQRLMREGISIRSFAEKDPTLEDVFMIVTKGLVT
jgi:ABC-2 type transport system ATP-binding protein